MAMYAYDVKLECLNQDQDECGVFPWRVELDPETFLGGKEAQLPPCLACGGAVRVREFVKAVLPASRTTRARQEKRRVFEYEEGGEFYRLTVTMHYDDELGNGHNTFSITGELRRMDRMNPKRWHTEACGCLHEQIEEHAPMLASLLKWHLVSSDGPLHYLSNTLFLASDKDCWGKRPGDIIATRYTIRCNRRDWPQLAEMVEEFGDRHPLLTDIDAESVEWEPKWIYLIKSKLLAQAIAAALPSGGAKAIPVHQRSEGKKPELELARKAAIAPEATVEQLQDRTWLVLHLAPLMVQFKAAMEELGFVY